MESGTAEWHALDTNDDGWVDMSDDPYTPFYPGDQWVDWVGMNMYHMGQVSLLFPSRTLQGQTVSWTHLP